ncbi:hypothetical protein Tco_0620575 [Tanacetum coccineum]
MYYPRFTKLIVNFVMAKDPLIPQRNKVNWHYARDDPMFTTINVISRNEDTQLYGTILPADKKKVDSDATTKKGKKTGKGKQKAKDLETISEAILTEAEQLKIITKRSRKRLTALMPAGLKSSEDDQDEDNNEDDTFDPIVHTPSHVSSSDDEDSDNEVEGVDVEGEKSDEDATYVKEQGNEADRYTNANLEGRDDVKADVVLPQSSSVSSGFVSNMLNPNQDTGVDAIFGHNAEATSLVDIPVTAIAEPSFFAPTNRPPTPTPLFTQLQQPPILTPATTPSSSLQNLPDFGSLFGFDNRLKALEDNFSEFKQTNQYAEALSSIPGIVDQYLANKMKEAVDVAVQLKSDRIREEAQAENQQFLDSIDEGMKKVIKEQVKSEVSKITPDTPQIEKQILQGSVDAYEAAKIIMLDTYGDTVSLKDSETEQMMIKKPPLLKQTGSFKEEVLSDIEDVHGPSDAMHKHLPAPSKLDATLFQNSRKHLSFLLTFSLRVRDIEKVALSSSLCINKINSAAIGVDPHGFKDLNGGRCWKGFGYKVVTKGCLEALVLKGGDGGACKLLGRLLGDVIEVLEIRNKDFSTELEYFIEEYDEEREMEPRPVRVKETTLVLRTRSPRARRQKKRVVEFEDTLNRDGSRVKRNYKGGRPSEHKVYDNKSQGMNLPPLLAAHLGRSKNGQHLQSSLASTYEGHQPSTNIGGNPPPNSTHLSHNAQPFVPNSL